MKVVYCKTCNYPVAWGDNPVVAGQHWHLPTLAWHTNFATLDIPSLTTKPFADVKPAVATALGLVAAQVPDEMAGPLEVSPLLVKV